MDPLIVAGSYERFLFGFQAPGAAPGTTGAPAALQRRFTYAAHQSAVKCIASAGPFLATGGGDDQIHLYDMKHGKDLGFLMNPGDGPVPCLEFYCPLSASGTPMASPTHMFSGSHDGSIAIWQAGKQWEHLKLMKGHKGAVNALSIHPTGRLALSTSHDSSLKMWDLSKGRCTYTTKLDAEGDDVAFSPAGDRFALTSGTKVTVHATNGEGGLLGNLVHSRRVLCRLQQQDNVLMTGLEDGSIKVWDLRTSAVQGSLEHAHSTRIRGLTAVRAGSGAPVPQQLASASSDGVVKLWDMRMLSSNSSKKSTSQGSGSGGLQASLLAEANTRARLTCLTTVDPAGQAARAGGAATAAAPVQQQRQQTAPSGNGVQGGDAAAASSAEDAAAEKRRKRAAKKRARAEAKAMQQQAGQAHSSGEDSEDSMEGGQRGKGNASGSEKAGQQQQQQQQRAQGKGMKGRKKQRVGNDTGDEFEVIPRESDSGEEEQTGGGHRGPNSNNSQNNTRQQGQAKPQRGRRQQKASSPRHQKGGGKQQQGGKKGAQRGKGHASGSRR